MLLKISLFWMILSLNACRHLDESSRLAGLDPKQQQRSDEIHQQIREHMRKLQGEQENKTWFESEAQLDDDWLIDTPQGYWKRDANSLPKGYACKSKEAGCDPQFERRICKLDADCAGSRTRCLDLLASVAVPGEKPKKMCLGSADLLMDRVYKTMTSAKKHLEMTSLASPTGRFRQVVINALAFLSQQNPPPTVRILFGGHSGGLPNYLYPKEKVLRELMLDVQKRGGKAASLPVNLSYLSDGKQSWNQSKIIVADQQRVLQGGHSLWDTDYLKEQPVFDLSMEASGRLGSGVQNFVSQLWSKESSFAAHPKDGARINPPDLGTSTEGNAKVLGLGRLGSFGGKPADEGIVALIRASKSSLKFAQQDLFYDFTRSGIKASWAIDALTDAVLRGVKVSVAQSSSTVMFGYGMVAADKAFKHLLDMTESEAKKRNWTPSRGTLRQYLCEHIEYAPLLFNSQLTRWPTGQAIAVHTKLIIADDASFYLGSQNFYPANHAEFGLIVSDGNAAAGLLERYWKPLWIESSSRKITCK